MQAKTVVEADTLDLYEWAILDIKPFSPEQYAATLGALRVRYAKANPKHPAALQGLELCIGRWDLVSAQQVGNPTDRCAVLTFVDCGCCRQGLSLAQGSPAYVLQHCLDVPTFGEYNAFGDACILTE